MLRNSKKVLALVLAIVLCAALLAGCGQQAAAPAAPTTANDKSVAAATPAPTVADAAPVTLKIMHWRVEDADVFKELNADFEKANPNIKIQMDMIPTKDYTNVLNIRVGSGETDIVGIEPIGQAINKEPGVIKSGSLVDLTGQDFLKNYNQSTLGKNAMYDGKIIAVPTSVNTVVVFYNKDLFKTMNIEVPKTYTAFIDACKKIKAAGTVPVAFGGKDGWPINVDMIGVEASIVRSQKPDFYEKLITGETKFTDPEFVEVLTKTKEVSTYFENKPLGVAYADTYTLFSQKKAAMILDGSWAAGDIQKANPGFEVGVFLFPGSDKVDPSKFVPVKYGLNWAVCSNSANKDAAFKYLSWFSQKDVYAKYITGIKQLPTQDGITFTDALQTSIAGLLTNNVEFMDQLYPAGSNLDPFKWLQEMIINAKTPEAVAKEMQATVDKIKK